jgi:hypothetical protein
MSRHPIGRGGTSSAYNLSGGSWISGFPIGVAEGFCPTGRVSENGLPSAPSRGLAPMLLHLGMTLRHRLH